jgi:large subunit ribosomal protein L21
MVGDHPAGTKIGQPVVPGARVIATVMGEHKAPKIEIRKFSRRKGYSLHNGHRQKYLKVKVETIEA